MARSITPRILLAVLVLACAPGIYAADKKSDGKVSSNDRSFIKTTAQDNLTEIELGKVAQQNASSAEVKKFGQRMVDDHSKIQQELETIGQKLGAQVPTAPSGSYEKAIKDLSKKTGARFDQDYAKDMVKGHEKAVSLFEKQSKKADSEDLRQFASKTLPILQEHLKLARALTPSKK
jgi:putative membrane protein